MGNGSRYRSGIVTQSAIGAGRLTVHFLVSVFDGEQFEYGSTNTPGKAVSSGQYLRFIR
jgi:hypothetical protein